MKIFYSFSGYGYGHASRSSTVIEFLRKLGHQVKAATYGQGLQFVQEIGLTDVVEIKGFKIYYRNNQFSSRKTLLQFFKQSPKIFFSNFPKFRKVLNDFQPDLIISDFEPFSVYWSKWKKLPLITVDNQSVLFKTKFRLPAKFLPRYLLAAGVVGLYTPKAEMGFILSFNPKLTPLWKRYLKHCCFVPPILRKKIFLLQPTNQNFILVYQTAPIYQKKLIRVLSRFPQIKFYVYNTGLKTAPRNNMFIRNFSEDEFLNDLANCRAVITNGGFTVISEAIYLNKPILSLPIKGDSEQTFNAILLEKSGYGKFAEDLNSQILQDFLNNLDFFVKNLRTYKQEENKIFEDKLRKILESLEENC